MFFLTFFVQFYTVNSFSSIIGLACFLVRLDEQFFSGAVEIFFGQRWLRPLLSGEPTESFWFNRWECILQGEGTV